MNQQRLDCERMILSVMSQLDDPKKYNGESPNSDFWIRQFAKMNDKEFEEFVCRPLSLYYQTSGLKREPSMININKALDLIKVPLLESVYLPYKYKNKNGKPIKSKPCLVIYLHMKRMKQLISKKNKLPTGDVLTRDVRTGLLTSYSKGGRESDLEFNSLAISGLNATIKELSRSRGDAMEDKSIMNNTIKTFGAVRLSDLRNDPHDSLGKKAIDAYLIGAQIGSNLMLTDYMTPYTLKMKSMRINRTD